MVRLLKIRNWLEDIFPLRGAIDTPFWTSGESWHGVQSRSGSPHLPVSSPIYNGFLSVIPTTKVFLDIQYGSRPLFPLTFQVEEGDWRGIQTLASRSFLTRLQEQVFTWYLQTIAEPPLNNWFMCKNFWPCERTAQSCSRQKDTANYNSPLQGILQGRFHDSHDWW